MPSVKCQICLTNFYVKPSHQKLGWGLYCSRKCRTKSQCKGKIVNCFICKKSIYRSIAQIKKSKTGYFFCTKSCQTKWRNKVFVAEKHPNWNKGVKSYRNRLLKNSNAQYCVCCNNKDIRVLAVHHIDHNRKNNNLNNLAWVCYNCHHLIHNYKIIENDFLVKLKKTRCL